MSTKWYCSYIMIFHFIYFDFWKSHEEIKNHFSILWAITRGWKTMYGTRKLIKKMSQDKYLSFSEMYDSAFSRLRIVAINCKQRFFDTILRHRKTRPERSGFYMEHSLCKEGARPNLLIWPDAALELLFRSHQR